MKRDVFSPSKAMWIAICVCALSLLQAHPARSGAEAEDVVQELLRERASEGGPVFPGDDPAFLVMPPATERTTMAEDLLTEETREMIDRSLEWLARTQNADGGWSDRHYESNTGVTALAILAFMAEGSRPRIGRYGRQINNGLEFLLGNVQTSGVIAGSGSNPYGPMYEHLYSTLALVLNMGDLPWEPEVNRVIADAIEVIQQSQKRDGGWRYQFSREGHSDISVTANALWVLRTAKKSGFTVSSESISQASNFIEQCAMPDGTFRYRYWGLHANPSMGGIGIIALASEGDLNHPLIPPTRDRIAYDYNRYTVRDILERDYFTYGMFYASLAMYTSGDEYFIPFYRKMFDIMRTAQLADGEFNDHRENEVYVTAMAAIALQAPYGYLPIYER